MKEWRRPVSGVLAVFGLAAVLAVLRWPDGPSDISNAAGDARVTEANAQVALLVDQRVVDAGPARINGGFG